MSKHSSGTCVQSGGDAGRQGVRLSNCCRSRRSAHWFCLLLGTLLMLLTASAQAAADDEVSIRRIDGSSGFFIDTRRPVQYRWFELGQPARLVLDLYDIESAMALPDIALSNTPVTRIRSGYRPREQRLRIVFDLRDATDPDITTVAPPREGAQRIRVTLPFSYREPVKARTRTPAQGTATPSEPLPPAPAAMEPAATEEREDLPRSWDYAFSGTWEQEWAVETDEGDAQKFEALVEPRIDIEIGRASITGIARVRLDTVGDIGPDQSSPPNYADINGPLANTAEAEFSLRELYLDFDLGDSVWRIGKQQLVWGEADGLKVLDVVNPQSFREFIMDDFDDSRIPLWMVSAEMPVGTEGSLQLLLIPDTTYHELAEPGTPYFVTSPLLVPEPVPGYAYRAERPDKPSGFSDGDAGARFSIFAGGWDLSFNYLYHYLDTPVFYQLLDTSGPVPVVSVTPEYERSHLGGVTLSNALGDLTLRGEVVYSSESYHTSSDLGSRGVSESAELSSVIGLDWQLGSLDAFVSGQWFQSHLLDHEPATVRSETTHTFSLLIQKNFINNTWTLDALGLYSLDNEDSQLQFKLRHLLFSNTEVWLGVDIFAGDDEGLFGQFSERDRALLGFEVGF